MKFSLTPLSVHHEPFSLSAEVKPDKGFNTAAVSSGRAGSVNGSSIGKALGLAEATAVAVAITDGVFVGTVDAWGVAVGAVARGLQPNAANVRTVTMTLFILELPNLLSSTFVWMAFVPAKGASEGHWLAMP